MIPQFSCSYHPVKNKYFLLKPSLTYHGVTQVIKVFDDYGYV